MERKIIMKKIIALIIVFVSITTVWAVKNSSEASSATGPRPANPALQNPMFDLEATGEFKLEDVVGKGYPVIINFSATWCGPCKRMKPIYKEANKKYKGKAILKTIDVDDPTMKEIVAVAGVSAIPHQIFFYPDGTIPTPERSPALFEKYGVKSVMNRRTFSTNVQRVGAMDKEIIDGIVKELSKPAPKEEAK